MGDIDAILITTVDSIDTPMRGYGPARLEVGVLAENVSLFLTQIEEVLEKAPDEVGKFKFTEFTISAEVSAEGKLILAGTGIEAGATGGLTFKFERKA
jgi:hypothetical protein